MTDLYQQVVRQRWGSSRVYVLYLVLFFGGLYGVSTSVALGTGLAESWNSGQLHTASAVTVLGVMLAALGAVMLLGAVMGPMLGEPFAVWLQDVQGREPPVIAWRMMRGKLCGAFACALVLGSTVVASFWVQSDRAGGLLWIVIALLLGVVSLTSGWALGQYLPTTSRARLLPLHLVLTGLLVILVGRGAAAESPFSADLFLGPWGVGVLGASALVTTTALVVCLRRMSLTELIGIAQTVSGRVAALYIGSYSELDVFGLRVPERRIRNSTFRHEGPVGSLRLTQLRRVTGGVPVAATLTTVMCCTFFWAGRSLDSNTTEAAIWLVVSACLSFGLWQTCGSHLPLARDLAGLRPVLGWSLREATWKLNRDIVTGGALVAALVVAVGGAAHGGSFPGGIGFSIACGSAVLLSLMASAHADLTAGQSTNPPAASPSPIGDVGGLRFLLSAFQSQIVMLICVTGLWFCLQESLIALLLFLAGAFWWLARTIRNEIDRAPS